MVPALRFAVLVSVALFREASAQPQNYNPESESITQHGRDLGWQRFYSRTHSHEEEYDTTRRWPGAGTSMYRDENLKIFLNPELTTDPDLIITDTNLQEILRAEPVGTQGAWSGGDVRLDKTNDKWPEVFPHMVSNCTDPNGAGIETLPSGLQYKILIKGSGTEYPRDDSACDVHYEAKKGLTGPVFESTYGLGSGTSLLTSMKMGAALLTPGQSIAAWREALMMMVTGDKWEIYVPSEMVIGPFSVWYGYGECYVFTLELVEISGGRNPTFGPPPPSSPPSSPPPAPPRPPPSSPPFFG